MVNVVFVVPYFGMNVRHCLAQLAGLEGVRLGLITREPEDRVPEFLRKRVAGHYRVANTLDPDQLILGARAFQKEWGKVDRLLAYMEEMQLPLAQARDALGIPGMRAEVAKSFRDKNRMKEVLARAGLPVARQARVTSGEDAQRFVTQVGYPIVLKPLAGVGTKDTMRVSNDGELYAALNRLLPSRQRPVQAEEFVSGEEFTFETASVNGEAVWHSSTYYLPGPLQVVENPWMQYCVLLPREPHKHAADFRELNVRALKALGMKTGLSHMEWFRRKDGSVVISEVAARPPGVNIMDMMGYAHGMDMWEKWIRLMVYGTFEAPERRWACGVAFLRGSGHGRVVSRVEGVEEIVRKLGDDVVRASLPKVGQPRSSHYEGEGFVVVRAEQTSEAVDKLRAIITQTTVEYR
jgi:formate-dependent phosphoribosylglycinamide formyltransferase (GAR transformylase)